MPEQRKSRRFDLQLPLELLRGAEHSLREAGETRNLSSCGVLFHSRARLEVGDALEYFITMPVASHALRLRLRCRGKVIRLVEGDSFAATLERWEFDRQMRLEAV